MIDFLYNNFSTLNYIFEALAVVTGLLCLKKYKGTAAVFFIGILVHLFLCDFLGQFPYWYKEFEFLSVLKNSNFKTNSWWFTIFFDIVAIILFSVFYQKILKNKMHINSIKYATYIYVLVAVFLIFNDLNNFYTSNFPLLYVLQTLIIITCSTLYFMEVMMSQSILKFHKSLYFYISFTIFIWWLVVTPLSFFDKYHNLRDEDFILIRRGIYVFSNVFMYTTFTIGLIVSTPEKSS